jgi:deoxyribodipyrimidine photo-lyase
VAVVAPDIAEAGLRELAEAGVVLGTDYPHPVVDHAAARERTLARYGVVRQAADDSK